MQDLGLGHSVILSGLRRFRQWLFDPTKGKKYRLGSETAVALLPAGWERWNGARPELRGAPHNSILAVRGLDKQPPIVRALLLDLADELGIPVDSLAVVIGHESGWREAAKNPLNAFGLIQLTSGARLPGFLDEASLHSVVCMSAEEQLRRVVLPYYERFGERARGAHVGQVAMLNFLPGAAGQPESHVLARRGEDVYQANTAFDPGGAKGFFTVGDVYDAFARIAGEAQGRRLAVDGRVIQGAILQNPVLPAAPVASHTTPAAKPKPAPWTVVHKPPPAPPTTRAEPEPVGSVFSSGTGWGATPPALLSAAPSQLSSGAGFAAPDPALFSADPSQLSARGMELRRSEDDEQPFGAELRAQGVDDMRGVLLAAVRAGQHRPEAYMELEVRIGNHDLVVTILRDALQARVDGRWLRLGVSYTEQIEICRILGLISPTREIVDAAWEFARAEGHLIDPIGLVHTREDSNRMATIPFAIKHNDIIEAALAKAGAQPDEFWRPYGKSWMIDRSMAEPDGAGVIRGVAEYGWRQRSGKPLQPMGPGGHNADHLDYSMTTAELVQRRARLASGEVVDLCDIYREVFPASMAPAIEAYR